MDQFRFDIMDLGEEVEEAYRLKLQSEKTARIKKKIAADKKFKREVEEKGVCEHCGSDVMPRWVNEGDCYCADGTFECYECFENNLSCWADVMVPARSVTQVEGYMDESTWEGLWEEEYN